MDRTRPAHNEHSEQESVQHPHIRSFAASRGRSLRLSQYDAWVNYYPLYSQGMGDLHLWSHAEGKPKIVEIGCGMGEATVEIAFKHPENEYLAIDVYKPGLARILQECHDKKIENLKILEGDAMLAIREFQKSSIVGFHIFFPDPWPKDRHHKRRLMRDEVIEQLGTALKSGGFLYFATDWLPYASDVLERLSASSLFENVYTDGDGFVHGAVPGRPSTRFEKKGLEKGHNTWELYFKRI